MKVLVAGLRGVPGLEGGIESHAEHLYPRLVRAGFDIEMLVRAPYFPEHRPRSWSGIKLTYLWSPRSSGLETLVHTFLAVLVAAWKKPDLLHLHAVGPGLAMPLAKILGLNVVFTHHGPDYDREKWNSFSKFLLRLGERLAVMLADEVIVISDVISRNIKELYGVIPHKILNGVISYPPTEFGPVCKTLALRPGKYFLQVSRFVPEKRQLDLIDAFQQTGLKDWKLVFAGAVPNDSYGQQIRDKVSNASNIILAGYVGGKDLHELYSNAGVFVLPSTHEGLPIALLEALSFGTPVVASDIPANLEVGLPQEHYFLSRDRQSLSEKLTLFAATPLSSCNRKSAMKAIARRYDWDRIAEETAEVFRQVATRSR